MKVSILTFLILGIVVFSSILVKAEAAPTPSPMTVTDAWADGQRFPGPTPLPSGTPAPDTMFADAGLRNRVWVEVEHLTESQINPHDLVLFLNGQELKGIKAVAIDGPKQNWLGFDLVKTEESNAIWRNILGSPIAAYRKVSVSVGLTGQKPVATTLGKPQPVLVLRLFYKRWFVISLIALALVLALFIYLAGWRGGLIHDSEPPDPPRDKMKPYSLALSQAAWWFFLVVGSFVFIYMITGDYNTITDQALILMGIGTGTALGSFMINASKRSTAATDLSTLVPSRAKLAAEIGQINDPVALAEKRAQLAVLNKQIADAEAGLTKPTSVWFLHDILTDVNGIALHRFQMVIWTVALGIMFLLGVYRNLAMPEFNVTLLALLGISASTYLGFKIPERQN